MISLLLLGFIMMIVVCAFLVGVIMTAGIFEKITPVAVVCSCSLLVIIVVLSGVTVNIARSASWAL